LAEEIRTRKKAYKCPLATIAAPAIPHSVDFEPARFQPPHRQSGYLELLFGVTADTDMSRTGLFTLNDLSCVYNPFFESAIQEALPKFFGKPPWASTAWFR